MSELATPDTQAQALVHVFEPYHQVSVQYPSAGLLDDIREAGGNITLIYLPAHNAESRYEPSALIQDEAVMAHARRDDQTSFTSYYRAPQPRTAEDSSPPGLVVTMSDVVKVVGDTTLSAATYSSSKPICDDAEADSWAAGQESREIAISIRSSFDQGRCKHGHCTQNHLIRTYSTYRMGLDKFPNLACDAQWYKDLRDLITGSSDRAVRHVRHRFELLHMDEFDLPDSQWKPARRALCEPALEAATSSVNITALPQDQQTCLVCREDFGANNEPRRMACHREHIICMPCLVTLFHSDGPDTLRCVLCRARLLPDEESNQALKFGTDGKAYHADPRFSHWENFERSCADLDHRLASNNRSRMQVPGAMAYDLFSNTFVHEARHEAPQSTPYHLQAVRRSELEALLRAAKAAFASEALAEHNREHGRIRGAFALLMDKIRSSLAAEFNDGDFVLREPPTSCNMETRLPSGFHAFIERALSRTLQFLHLRSCDCRGVSGPGGPFQLHFHGLREYYIIRAYSFVPDGCCLS
ncbi:zinc finger protein, RING-type [Teratosphaeria destructans]|uniref:Zinc finger protein, RING-type n=1 Tax=Teratosphaeria destructans TaxID=418781 RepID=A0A9W7SXE6_9PEZI|nr:zinc finger protein, RING-type [Teratosphaeria destructans]